MIFLHCEACTTSGRICAVHMKHVRRHWFDADRCTSMDCADKKCSSCMMKQLRPQFLDLHGAADVLCYPNFIDIFKDGFQILHLESKTIEDRGSVNRLLSAPAFVHVPEDLDSSILIAKSGDSSVLSVHGSNQETFYDSLVGPIILMNFLEAGHEIREGYIKLSDGGALQTFPDLIFRFCMMFKITRSCTIDWCSRDLTRSDFTYT